jgi:hypothetical protein
MIYEKDHRNRLARDVAVSHMGYTGLNGASLGVLSALIKYGLLEGRGAELRVSDEAVVMLVDPLESRERAMAIQEAAVRPALFGELYKRFGGPSLPSEENLRAHLQKMGFTPVAATNASRAFRETVELVSESEKAHPLSHAEQRGLEEVPMEPVPSRPIKDTGEQSLKMRISRDCMATLTFQGPVTQGAIRKLIALLDLSRDDYPETIDGES